ncbi:MAG: hypothetical protein ACFCGT_05875 [Sandaracinaceae bacterium]
MSRAAKAPTGPQPRAKDDAPADRSRPSFVLRVGRVGVGLLAVLAIGLAVSVTAWHLLEGSPNVAEASAAVPASFDVDELLILVDADMAATAYADGILHPIPDTHDGLYALSGDALDVENVSPASNSVAGWPGSLAVDPRRRLAYVIEVKAPVGRSRERVESVYEGFGNGRRLAAIDLEEGRVARTVTACPALRSIDLAPGAGWLLAACGTRQSELTVIPLDDAGLPGAPRPLDLPLEELATQPRDRGATYAAVHPAGAAAAVIQANRAVHLIRFERDAAGVPVESTLEPGAAQDAWLTVARWTRTGDHLLVSDVGWGPSPVSAVFNGPGAILSFALSPDDDRRGLVSRAEVSRSPEAFEMDRTGSLLAVVNMERTYLPSGLLSLVPGRGASSLSLVSVDDRTGTLRTLGPPVGFRGVLPEDVAFDRDGDQLAVVVFQDHDDPRSAGWLELFAVDRSGDEPRVARTGRRIPLPRGGHDLVAVY